MKRSPWLDKRDEELWSEVTALKESDLPPTMKAIAKKLAPKYGFTSESAFTNLFHKMSKDKKAKADKLALEKLKKSTRQISMNLRA